MISIEYCKTKLVEYDLTDREIEEFRNAWYNIINHIIDYEIQKIYEKAQSTK